MSTIKVVAVRPGFYKGSRVRAGQTFEFEGKKLGSWMALADAKARQVAAKRPPADEKAAGDTKPAEATAAAAEKASNANLV